MDKTIQNRLDWVDISKGIGIFLVVMGHTTLPFELRKWIYSFHMPLFFFLSGYFFRSGKYTIKTLVKKRFKTLIIPFFAFIIINWIVFEILIRYGEKRYDIVHVLINGPKDPTWFLVTLFVVELLHQIVDSFACNRLVHNNITRMVWGVVVVCLPLLNYIFIHLIDLHLPYEMVYVPHYLFFYIIGRLHWLDVNNRCAVWCIFLLFIVDILLEHDLPYGIGASESIYLYTKSYIVALLGIFITINFAFKLSHSEFTIAKKCNPIILFFGYNSIIVLGLHTPFVRTIKCLFDSLGANQFWSFPVRQVLLWALLALAIVAINRWLPWIIGRKHETR